MKLARTLAATLLYFSVNSICLAQSAFNPRTFADFEPALGGQLPFPAEKLVQSLLKIDPNSYAFAEIIPHGRSLERSFTDFKQPRTVFLWRSGSPLNPYFLFLGFTPKTQQVEVMAWNWNTHQFDFMLLQDYAPGKTPRVQRVARATCTSCHQSGGPIFSISPWSETTAKPLIRTTVLRQGQDSLSQWLMGAGRSRRMITEAPTFDLQVQDTTRFLQMQKVCRDACGGNLECRRGVLYAAMIGAVSHIGANQIPDKLLSAIRDGADLNWPEDRFALANPRLEDRNVDLSDPLEFSKQQDPLQIRKSTFRISPQDATGRMMNEYSKCWNFDSEQMEEIKNWGPQTLAAALQTEQVQTAVKDWLPSEASVMNAIRSAVESPKAIHSPDKVDWPLNHQQPPRDPAPVDTATLFVKYCASCHSGPSTTPPILPLSDLNALYAYRSSGQRVLSDLLNDGIMPPRGAPQPTLEERAQMIRHSPLQNGQTK